MKSLMPLVLLLVCRIHAVFSVDWNGGLPILAANSNSVYQFGAIVLAVAVILIGRRLCNLTYVPTVETPEANCNALIGKRAELKCLVTSSLPITSVSWQKFLPEGQVVQLSLDQWKYSGSKLNQPNLIINKITKGDEGEYVCTVSNFCGSGQSAPVKLKVEGGPPTLNMNPKTHYKTEGEAAILKCTVTAKPLASDITWTKEEEGSKREIAIDNDKYLGGTLDTPSLVIDKTEKNYDEGIYICEAENIAGPGSNSVLLNINKKTAKNETTLQDEENDDVLKQCVISRHSLMVNELFEFINPKTDIWAQFKQLLTGYLPLTVLNTDDFHMFVQKLLDSEDIHIGQYGPLYFAVYKVNRRASRVIEKAVSEIKTMNGAKIPNERPAGLECKFEGSYQPNLPKLCTSQTTNQYPEVNGRISVTGGQGCIYLKFTISEAKTPYQLSALFLAVTLKTKLENRQIVLKDESCVPLVLKTSPRIVLPTKTPEDMPTICTSRGYYRFTEGQVAILKCAVVAKAETKYIQWFRFKDGKCQNIRINNEKYFGGSSKSPSLAIADVDSSDRGIYFCRAGYSAGEVESDTAFLEINYADGSVTRQEHGSLRIKDVSTANEVFGDVMMNAVDETEDSGAVREDAVDETEDAGAVKEDAVDETEDAVAVKQDAGDETKDAGALKEDAGDLGTRQEHDSITIKDARTLNDVMVEAGDETEDACAVNEDADGQGPEVEFCLDPHDEPDHEPKSVPFPELHDLPSSEPPEDQKTETSDEHGIQPKANDGQGPEVEFCLDPHDEPDHEPKSVPFPELHDLPSPEPPEDRETETSDEHGIQPKANEDTYRLLAQKYKLTDDCVVPVKDASNQQDLIIIYDPSCNTERNLTELGHHVTIRNPKNVNTEGAMVSSICKSKQYSIRSEDRNMLKQALNHHSKDLFASHSNLNIITTSPVKSKNKGADIIERPCIVLVCSSKGYIPKGESKFPEELIFEDQSFVVDVREGYFQFTPSSYLTYGSSLHHQNIKMGCSFGIEGTSNAGTIGPFVDFQGHQLFLTCAHIVNGIDPNGYDLNHIQNMFAEQPHAMTNPYPQLAGTITRRCGEVRRAVFSPNNNLCSVDAAIVEITEQSRLPNRGEFAIDTELNLKMAGFDDLPRFEFGDIHENPDTLNTDWRIVKFGAATHATRGVISSLGTSARPLTTDLGLQGQPNMCVMKNQIEVFSLQGHSSFFSPGDSGSGVFVVKKSLTGEQILTCIGLAIGSTSYGSAVVTPIAIVFDALGLPRQLKQFP